MDNSVIVNQNVLTANLFGATYQWFDCNTAQDIPGETNQTFTAMATGNYFSVGFNSIFCSKIFKFECLTWLNNRAQVVYLINTNNNDKNDCNLPGCCPAVCCLQKN